GPALGPETANPSNEMLAINANQRQSLLSVVTIDPGLDLTSVLERPDRQGQRPGHGLARKDVPYEPLHQWLAASVPSLDDQVGDLRPAPPPIGDRDPGSVMFILQLHVQ